jgi:hypothetical protein
MKQNKPNTSTTGEIKRKSKDELGKMNVQRITAYYKAETKRWHQEYPWC